MSDDVNYLGIPNPESRWWTVREKGTRAVLVTQVTEQQAIHCANCIQAQTGSGTFIEADPYDAVGANIAPIYPWHELVAHGWVPSDDDLDPEVGPSGEIEGFSSQPVPNTVVLGRNMSAPTYGRSDRFGPYWRQVIRFVGRALERLGARLDSWSWDWR